MTAATPDRRVYDVRIWGVRSNRGQNGTTYTVRWRVGRRAHQRTFATAKLGESFRSGLIVASHKGEPFDERTGLPDAMVPRTVAITWYRHACAFVDLKWPAASPRHRKGIAEGLITGTVASASRVPGAPALDLLRRALLRWAFNTGARRRLPIDEAVCPAEFAETLRWLDNNTPTLDEFARPVILRPVLDSLALRLDGSPASASTVGPQEVRRLQRPGLRGRTGASRNQPHGPHPQSARTAHRRCRPACRCQPPAGRESLTGRPNDPPVNRGVLRVPVLRRPAAGRGATSSREQPLVTRDRLGLCAP